MAKPMADHTPSSSQAMTKITTPTMPMVVY